MPDQKLRRGQAGGRALFQQRGVEYMREIGSAGYWACAAKIGFEATNAIIFGTHHRYKIDRDGQRNAGRQRRMTLGTGGKDASEKQH